MRQERQKITAIVCAYNEERTIKGILEALLKCAQLDEIIIVNDGSTDDTLKILKEEAKQDRLNRLRIIELPENKGKGFALAEGIAKAKNELLIFVDADLMNFKAEYLNQLIRPLLGGEAKMVIGQPTENIFDSRMNPLKPLAGERALFRKDVLALVEKMRESHFGVEALINLYYKAHNMKTTYVSLWGLKHSIKFQKYPMRKAILEYYLAAKQIIKTAAKNYLFIILIIRNFLK